VCEVEESPSSKFYGCGSCGHVWHSIEQLNVAIDKIISQYSYRKNVYSKSGSNWQAVDIDDEPEEYEELVVSEWDDE
jgi:hypothetical protein